MQRNRNLIIALAALGLVRPALSIAGLSDSAVVPLLVTALTAVIWVGATVVRRAASPVATLAAAGGLYGVLVVVLQPVVAAVVGSGPRSLPVIGVVAVIVTNVLYGAALGLLAAGIMRVTGRRVGDPSTRV